MNHRQDSHDRATEAWARDGYTSPLAGLGERRRIERSTFRTPITEVTAGLMQQLRVSKQAQLKHRLKLAYDRQRRPYEYHDTSRYVAHAGRKELDR